MSRKKQVISKQKPADINVVPLIDIVLVLLIIFMVITPLIVKQMDVNIPEKDVQPEETPPPPNPDDVPQIFLMMTKDFNTYLGNDPAPVPRTELANRINAIVRGRADKDKVLFFDAQDQTNYGETVKVLDIVRGAGVQKIGLITDRTNMTFPGDTPPGAPPGVPAVPAPPPK